MFIFLNGYASGLGVKPERLGCGVPDVLCYVVVGCFLACSLVCWNWSWNLIWIGCSRMRNSPDGRSVSEGRDDVCVLMGHRNGLNRCVLHLHFYPNFYSNENVEGNPIWVHLTYRTPGRSRPNFPY